jgi:phosphoglycolate phosphatase
VLFDKDGTLCRSDGYLCALAQARAQSCVELCGDPELLTPLLQAQGIRGGSLDPAGAMAVASRHENLISCATVLAAAGHSWGQARRWARAAMDHADEQLAAFKAERTPPTAGLPRLLERLSSRGIKLAVLSSDTGPSLEAFLKAHELRHWFSAVHGCDREPRKPDPAAVLALCDTLQVRPERCGLIGDADDDLAMAKTAGLAWSLAYTSGWQRLLPLEGSHGSLASWDEMPEL